MSATTNTACDHKYRNGRCVFCNSEQYFAPPSSVSPNVAGASEEEKETPDGGSPDAVEAATLRGQTNLPLNLRERDLLRYCRGELHVAGLVTDDEYAEMLGWSSAKAGGGSHAARRLEDYNELRAEIDRLHEGVELIARSVPQ